VNRAVFLDRDGTINEDVGWLYEPEKLVFPDRAVDALIKLQKKFSLYVITNQGGIGEEAYFQAMIMKNLPLISGKN